MICNSNETLQRSAAVVIDFEDDVRLQLGLNVLNEGMVAAAYYWLLRSLSAASVTMFCCS